VEVPSVTQDVHAQVRLRGHPSDAPAPQPKASGWHLTDWGCELVGTAFQLFVGFGVVAVLEAPQSPVTAALPGWLRLVLIGAAFGVLAAAVALSPPGRRSGAHLNPAVTFGFFLRKHTPWRDLVGYAAAQTVGALIAAFAFRGVWQGWAGGVHGARTAPEAGLPTWAVAGIEAALTFGLLTVVFWMVSSSRTARWTPAVVTGALAGLIWAGAAPTGASMNPARTLGPDVATGGYPVLWAYFAGPLAGAALAAVFFAVAVRERTTLTAKLFHDPTYPSVHATSLPAKPHRGTNQTAGRNQRDAYPSDSANRQATSSHA
jgi:aquaporin Z